MAYEVWGMSNLTQDETGLPLALMISFAPPNKKIPRVKVATSPKYFSERYKHLNFSLSIEEHPVPVAGKSNIVDFSSDDVAAIEEWVSVNRSVLLKYWYGFLESTRKVEMLLLEHKDEGDSFTHIVRRLQSLWNKGSTLKEMSTQTGYHSELIGDLIKVNSELFPKRRKRK